MIRSHETVEQDALGEAGNVGAGRAASALEFFTTRVCRVRPPRVGRGARPLGLVEVGMDLAGEVQGQVLMLLNAPSVDGLFYRLGRPAPADLTRLDGMESSVLREMANVLGCAYLLGLSDLTGLSFEPGVPHLHLGGQGPEAFDGIWIASRLHGEEGFEAEMVLVLEGEGAGRILRALSRAA